jgi:sulfite reductase (NADPH) hemoprotein beta-component
VYNLEGRRDNIHKARIKFVVKANGMEKFREMVDAEWAASKHYAPVWSEAEIARVKGFFKAPAYQSLQDMDVISGKSNEFRRWYQQNTRAHKATGYRAVILSLKSVKRPPGDITDSQMEAVSDLADQYSFGEVRVMHDQNLLFAHVRQQDLFELWQKLTAIDLATANIGTLTDMIACPGLDLCSLANARTYTVVDLINQKFEDLDYLYDLGEIQLKMSGCMNACGHHHVGHIGILGVDKHGEEWYQVTIGGAPSGSEADLGEVIGRSFKQEEIPDVLERMFRVYLDIREGDERFVDTVRRTGIAPFKAGAYAQANQAA